MAKNTSITEDFDEAQNTLDGGEALTQEKILMSESDILAGLLKSGRERGDEESYREIQIKRKGEARFGFRVRPISEEENQACWRKATKYARTKPGQPRVELETDRALYRSYIIYTATVDEDRAKVWDRKEALRALGLSLGVEMIDKVLLAGEKEKVIGVIDEISGFGEDAEELAKN